MRDSYRRIRNTAALPARQPARLRSGAASRAGRADAWRSTSWALRSSACDLQQDDRRGLRALRVPPDLPEGAQLLRRTTWAASISTSSRIACTRRRPTSRGAPLARRRAMYHIARGDGALARADPVVHRRGDLAATCRAARGESVFLETWHDVPQATQGVAELRSTGPTLIALRTTSRAKLEKLRATGDDRRAAGSRGRRLLRRRRVHGRARGAGRRTALPLITSDARVDERRAARRPRRCRSSRSRQTAAACGSRVRETEHAKCVRCWHHRADVGAIARTSGTVRRAASSNVEGPGETDGSSHEHVRPRTVAAPGARSGWRWLWLTRGGRSARPAERSAWIVHACSSRSSASRRAAGARLSSLRYNTGAAFSFLADASGWQRWLFTCSLAVSARAHRLAAPHCARRSGCMALPLALILGGALGNVIDRAAPRPRDRFHRRSHWTSILPAFNVADSAITVGAALLILFDARRSRSRRAHGQISRAWRSCSPIRAASAPASTAPSRSSSARSSCSARRSTCATKSCTTATSSSGCARLGAVFVDELDEVPDGATVIFSRARRVAARCEDEAHARGLQRVRRHLSAGDQGAHGSRALRARGGATWS